MKRVHPDDQENVYPGGRNPGLAQFRHHFDRVNDVPRPQFPPPHLGSGPGPNQGAPSGGSTVHPHAQGQNVHVQAPSFAAHPQNSAAQVTGQQHFQRLKVEDALSYLDQVKLQFGSQPHVYNEFLDIMKEFKSQTIDTPGVISRVSNLFKGHPDLIVGFNTFLPPGYKIEAHMGDSNTISVHGPGANNIQTIIQNIGPAIPTPTTKAHSQQSASNPPSSSFTPPHQQQQTQPQQQQQSSAPPIAPPQSSQPSLQKQQLAPPQASVPQTQPSQNAPLPSPGTTSSGGQSQTQVNKAQHHAINYVTKIKNRFQGQPEVYQKFLDILNNYQTEQKNIKENAVDSFGRPLTEQEIYSREGKLANEVYQQVAKLFQNQDDLLQEFSQFLPDASGGHISISQANQIRENATASYMPPAKKSVSSLSKQKQQSRKSSSTAPLTPPLKSEAVDNDSKDGMDKISTKKKHRSALKDVSLAEAVKHGSFSEFAFFNKVRKALKSQEVYDNFLRCLVLFNQEVVSRPELIQIMTSFLGKFPDLFTWFKMFLGYKENQPIDPVAGFKDRGTGGELAHLEIDYAACKRSGASYRALPQSYNQPKCTGRSQLCKETLNDVWVSLPSWSEDTQFPGTRKTQYEEYIYKCEDERFELDIVIETNLSAIKALEVVHKKLFRMSYDEQQRFRLDNALGGNSEVLCRKAICRIYGDKSREIIDGLKKTPHVAVPLVLKRLKSKDEEWREAQKQFNKIWREQNEKYYLKSLDHQGINFKQTDYKAMRSKSLIHEIEQLFEERTDQAEDGNAEISGPHLNYTYKDKSILDDAAALIVHHMKRQAGIQQEDKSKIKHLLYQFIPDLFFAPRTDLSDDEECKDQPTKSELFSASGDSHDLYNLFFVNNTWYIFFRLHQMLCDRLLTMYELAMRIAEEEAKDKKHRREGTAVALRLKQPSTIDVEEYFPAFLEMVKNLLDGNMDVNNFEDTLREMFGVRAYISFTMDRLIQNIVRQLQNLVSDDSSLQVTETFKTEKTNDATGGPSATVTARAAAEVTYQKNVENLLSEENCFKVVFHKDRAVCTVSIELLPSEEDQCEDTQEDEKWSEYVEKFVASGEVSTDLRDLLCKKKLFLERNGRRLRAKSLKADSAIEREISEEDKGSSTDETTSGNEIADKPKGKIFEDVVTEDRLECKFNINSYKIVYVAGTEDLMYRKRGMQRAYKSHPLVNTKLHKNFKSRHDRWLADNVSREQTKLSDDWLLGKTDGLRPCSTIKNTIKHGGLICSIYSVKYLE